MSAEYVYAVTFLATHVTRPNLRTQVTQQSRGVSEDQAVADARATWSDGESWILGDLMSVERRYRVSP